MKFYAVRCAAPLASLKVDACCAQVHHFGAEYKAFSHREDAEAFLLSPSSSQPIKRSEQPQQHPPPLSKFGWMDPLRRAMALRLGWGLLVKRNGVEIHRDKGERYSAGSHESPKCRWEILAILKAITWCKSQRNNRNDDLLLTLRTGKLGNRSLAHQTAIYPPTHSRSRNQASRFTGSK